MRSYGNKKRALGVLMAFLMLFTVCFGCRDFAYATSSSELKAQSRKLKEQQAAAEQEEARLREAKQQLMDQLGDMNSELYTISMGIADLEEDIYETSEDISRTQEQLAVQEQIAADQYEDMKLRIQYVYENSSQLSLLSLFFSSESVADMLNRATYMSAVTTYDRQQLEEYQDTLRQIAEAKENLETQMANLQEQQASLQEQQNQLYTAIAKKQADLSETQSSLATAEANNEAREAKLASLQDQISKMEAYEAQLEEQKRKQEEAAASSSSSSSSSSGSSSSGSSSSGSSSSGSSSTGSSSSGSSSSGSSSSSSGSSGTSSTGSGSSGSSSSGSGSTSSGSSGSSSSSSSSSDLELLAAIIYCEARPNSYDGQLAVGSVIMNRVESSKFPNTITGVVYQRGQFTPASSGRLAVVLENGLANQSCRKAAAEILAGTRTGDWLFFHSENSKGHAGENIGGNIFY